MFLYIWLCCICMHLHYLFLLFQFRYLIISRSCSTCWCGDRCFWVVVKNLWTREQWNKTWVFIRVYRGLCYPILWGLYNKPEGSLLDNQYFMESKRFFFVAHVTSKAFWLRIYMYFLVEAGTCLAHLIGLVIRFFQAKFVGCSISYSYSDLIIATFSS